MYNNGFGVNQNHKKALELYNIACDGGFAAACQNIGWMYYNGQGMQRDMVKGAAYFRRACDSGNWMACSNFASYHYSFGDKSKAAQYLKKACNLGKDEYSVQNIKVNGKKLAICMTS